MRPIQKLGLGACIGGVVLGATLMVGGAIYGYSTYEPKPTPNVKRIIEIEKELDYISAKQVVRDQEIRNNVSKLESELLSLELDPRVIQNKEEYDSAYKRYKHKENEEDKYTLFGFILWALSSGLGIAAYSSAEMESRRKLNNKDN